MRSCSIPWLDQASLILFPTCEVGAISGSRRGWSSLNDNNGPWWGRKEAEKGGYYRFIFCWMICWRNTAESGTTRNLLTGCLEAIVPKGVDHETALPRSTSILWIAVTDDKFTASESSRVLCSHNKTWMEALDTHCLEWTGLLLKSNCWQQWLLFPCYSLRNHTTIWPLNCRKRPYMSWDWVFYGESQELSRPSLIISHAPFSRLECCRLNPFFNLREFSIST